MGLLLQKDIFTTFRVESVRTPETYQYLKLNLILAR